MSAEWRAVICTLTGDRLETVRRSRQKNSDDDGGKKGDARTALTGSSYRRTGHNRYSVISTRSRHESSHYDREFIGVHADRGGPASVFHTITGHHRIPASRRQQPPTEASYHRSRLARKSTFVTTIADTSRRACAQIHFEFALRDSR